MTSTSFKFVINNGDGHIRALSRAIGVASRLSQNGVIQFTPEKLKLSTNHEHAMVYFAFNKDFFSQYNCSDIHKCYINLKALQQPFKSVLLNCDRESSHRPPVVVECSVEDKLNNQIVFKITNSQSQTNSESVATLTYKIPINDPDDIKNQLLDCMIVKIKERLVEITPNQSKKDKFLTSAFNSFAPDIDQVSIRVTDREIKFIGSAGIMLHTQTTSEFAHSKDDFYQYEVKEKLELGLPLKSLKDFLKFVETNKATTIPKFIFEGPGRPAHFIYEGDLFKGHFVAATSSDYIGGDDTCQLDMLAITDGRDESFVDNFVPPEETGDNNETLNQYNNEDLDNESTGYNEESSESSFTSELMDSNLTGLNIASMKRTYDPDRIREILNLDEDPDDYANVVVHYSSDESLD